MSLKRPLILVTNDDGISSKGILSLYEAVREFGDIVIIAPNSPQSGMGHAITINEPLRLHVSNLFGDTPAYACSGSPVDCVKIGVYEVLHCKPDLIVSGINHGANTSSNVLYSGTMSAAVEGAMQGIDSVGFSLCNFDSYADFTASITVVKNVVEQILKNGIMNRTCLNVNIPNVPIGELKGIKICRQAHAFWKDSFDKREDQFGNPYYWLRGEFLEQDKLDDTDLLWIEKGHPTIVPTQFDMTAYKAIKDLENWNL
jgi:5'-nucleotidase